MNTTRKLVLSLTVLVVLFLVVFDGVFAIGLVNRQQDSASSKTKSFINQAQPDSMLSRPGNSSKRGLLVRHKKIRKSLGRLLSKVKQDERVRILVQYKNFPQENRLAPFRDTKVLKHSFKYQPFIAVELTLPQILELVKDDLVSVVEPDFTMHVTLDSSSKQINAPEVTKTYGFTGKGIRVAIVDTGVKSDHPGLKDKVVDSHDFTSDGTVEDLNGHGTNVACIVACNDEKYRGVAPGASIMNVKVLNKDGQGNSSDVIAGIEWAIDTGADVINMSLRAPISECDGSDSLSKVVQAAIEKGVSVVVAAGNEGPYEGTLGTPGCADAPITVGAINDYNKIAYFSSRGPTSDGRVKPDVVAPGVEITAASLDGGYAPSSGTSQATPHVAGITALMLEGKPDIDHWQIKKFLMDTAVDLGEDPYTQGEGMVNAPEAVKAMAVAVTGVQEEQPTGETSEGTSSTGEPSENTGASSSEEEKQSEETPEAELTDQEKAENQTIDNLASCLDVAGIDKTKKDACFEQFIHDEENIEHAKLSEDEMKLEDELAELIIQVDNEFGETYSTADLKKILGTYLYTQRSLQTLKELITNLLNQLKEDQLTEYQAQETVTTLENRALSEQPMSREDKFERKMLDFEDVDNNTWFLYYVRDVKRRGCVSGYKDSSGNPTGQYGPANKLTVAEGLKISLECTGHPASSAEGEPSDPDLAKHWAHQYFAIAEDMGLTIMKNLDNPDRPLSRAEVTRLVLETLGKKPDNSYKGVFSDVSESNPDALWIEYAWSYEIVSGDAFKTTFRPQDPINRAEITKVVRQAVEAKFEKTES